MVSRELERRLNSQGRIIRDHISPFDFSKGIGLYDNYLTIDVDFEPIQKLRLQLEKNQGLDLSIIEKERGQEAHITVISPTEFWSLSPVISCEELHERARAEKLHQAPFKVEGIGQGTVREAGLLKRTFFLVICCPQLLEFRKSLERLPNISRQFVAEKLLSAHYYWLHTS
ncbi:MAG: hypothetical protein R2827_09010 [Bdellovibrionales bacterium]